MAFKNLRAFRLTIAFTLLISLGLAGVWYVLVHLYQAPGPGIVEKVVIIPKGAGTVAIADLLQERGVVACSKVFLANYYGHRNLQVLKAGEYAVSPKISVQNVLEKIFRGQVVLHRLTFAEGLNSQDILAIINSHEVLNGELVQNLPEGSCLPETYTVVRGYNRSHLIADMQKALQNFLGQLTYRGPMPLAPLERLVLASLVEKETALDRERPLVAGVYFNRLRLGMPLQCDPTVIYALRLINGGPLNRTLTTGDLKVDHPYNTYVKKGLPPGAICHPGKTSIRAVFQPLETKALYFVADGTGGHRFADSLSEHQKNHAAWRKIRAGKTSP